MYLFACVLFDLSSLVCALCCSRSLAQKLELSEEEAEKWIVNLIRHSKVSAKIDSQSNQLHINNNFPSIYQQVIDKTKPLVTRTQILVNSLERRERSASS
jgi:translation initiation factor 3 subunit E